RTRQTHDTLPSRFDADSTVRPTGSVRANYGMIRLRNQSIVLGCLAVGLIVSCGKDSAPIPAAPTPIPTPTVGANPPKPAIEPSGVLVGAGDIGWCGGGAEATGRLLDRMPGTVFTAGDNAYMSG